VPEETPQLPVSEQEVQIEAPLRSTEGGEFLDKLKLQKKKILIGLGVLFGILALAGSILGAYLISQRQVYPEPVEGPTPTPEVATPTPDPTAAWETYTNTKYGYSIKHSQDVKVREDKTQNLVFFEFAEKGDWVADLLIKHYQNPEGLGPQSFWQKLFEEGKLEAQRKNWPPPSEPLESETIKINNLEGFQIRNSAYEAYQRVTYLGQGKTMVVISFYDENPNDPFQEEHLEVFNLILSTFKFLEEDSAHTCIERDSLNCTDIPGLTFECTLEYQEWAEENCLSWQEGALCTESDTGDSMTLTEAKEIALASECVEEGSLTDNSFCNEDTGTWWIDLDINRPGCAPACVINVSTKEAVINWRCTGLIPD
jgi:hypothetical protein